MLRRNFAGLMRLVIRERSVFCTHCRMEEPVHIGGGMQVGPFIVALERLAEIHDSCEDPAMAAIADGIAASAPVHETGEDGDEG